jgi:hypothetical protein
MSEKNRIKAFPNEGYKSDIFDGMSLRDYFAAKAMQAIISNSDKQSIAFGEVDNWVGDYAYDVADAMMEARENDI